MVQVGFVGYAVCGAFLGLAYFDLPYLMMAVIVVANSLTRNAGQKSAQPTPAPGPDRPSYRRLAPAKSLGPSMPRRASK
jgi:hypothetical protein